MSTAPELIVGYDAFVDALCAELEDTHAGDCVECRTYLVEPGESSERVLAGFARAAGRGVRLSIEVDWTMGSHLSRAWERTNTLVPRVLELADHFDNVDAGKRRIPDHSKAILFRRQGDATGLFGGCNLGDRFRAWRDVTVRVEGDLVGAVRAAISDDRAVPPPFDPRTPVSIVSNTPGTGDFRVRPALETIFRDDSFVRFDIAMAYIDRWGSRLVEAALSRGARVRLVAPGRANVYHHANMRTLCRLRAQGAEVCEANPMLHAKAFTATREDGSRVAWVGSANLKRNSFRLLGELCLFTHDPSFTNGLARAIDSFDEGPVTAFAYNPLYAAIEERFG